MEIFDYRSETFSPPPCRELLCSICHCVLYNPVECPCQHVFCRSCLESRLQDRKACPQCEEPVDQSSLVKTSYLVRNIILSLKLVCKNSSRGCQETCCVEHYEVHLKVCPYQIMKCSNGNCESEIILKDKVKHEDLECFFYYVSCTVCKKPVMRHKLLDHDCFGALTGELDALKQRMVELEDEKGVLQNQIKELSKKFVEMHEGASQILHGMGDLKHKCVKYVEDQAAYCTLRKEVEMLRNVVEAFQKPAEQSVCLLEEHKINQSSVVRLSDERWALCFWFVVTVFVVWLLQSSLFWCV